ncbi:MAG TPA: aldo/keto reductase [Steroidobacteraceae bacterium]|jgi:diketogulonate reductase-like aldo/keto reductase|nr:aldo/keto reductase [Steroidobacteraceae bacterium]
MTAKSNTRLFGTTRRQVAGIGQGTWKIDASAADAAVAALRRGLDLGLTHIDTAEMYGSGASERIIAKAIDGRRDEVFLVSKVLPYHASTAGVAAACEKSLANLRTERLDCYLLHWRGGVPLAETIAAFETLLRQGKILSWGVSNFDEQDLAEVAAIAGPGHPACNQVLYHLRERAIEHAVLPWCREHGCAVVAYTPFGQSPAIYNGASKPARVLREIADAHGATPRQVALRFLLRHPETFVIPKASDVAHVTENAGANAFELSAADIAKIDAAFPRGMAPHGLPMI